MRRRSSAAIVLAAILAVGSGCVPGDSPPVEETAAGETGPSDAQAAAVPYIGLDGQAALDLAVENGDNARVGTADDVGDPGQTADYVVGRLTFVTVDGVVVEVIVETEAGPVTVAAG